MSCCILSHPMQLPTARPFMPLLSFQVPHRPKHSYWRLRPRDHPKTPHCRRGFWGPIFSGSRVYFSSLLLSSVKFFYLGPFGSRGKALTKHVEATALKSAWRSNPDMNRSHQRFTLTRYPLADMKNHAPKPMRKKPQIRTMT